MRILASVHRVSVGAVAVQVVRGALVVAEVALGAVAPAAEQDKEAKRLLDQMVGEKWHYSLLNSTCQDFSREMMDYFREQFNIPYEPSPKVTFDSRGWRGGDL